MRKFFAILMLCVYLFNLAGYPLLFNFLMDKATQDLTVQLDQNNYDEMALLEVKVPLNAPYITGNNSYERYDGQTEVNGVRYSYVKRKVYNDTLYMLCLPDEKGTKLLAARNGYGKQVTDVPAGKNEKEGSAKKGGPSLPYTNKEILLSFSAIEASGKRSGYAVVANRLPSVFLSTHGQPPDHSFYAI